MYLIKRKQEWHMYALKMITYNWYGSDNTEDEGSHNWELTLYIFVFKFSILTPWILQVNVSQMKKTWNVFIQARVEQFDIKL